MNVALNKFCHPSRRSKNSHALAQSNRRWIVMNLNHWIVVYRCVVENKRSNDSFSQGWDKKKQRRSARRRRKIGKKRGSFQVFSQDNYISILLNANEIALLSFEKQVMLGGTVLHKVGVYGNAKWRKCQINNTTTVMTKMQQQQQQCAPRTKRTYIIEFLALPLANRISEV